MIDQFSESSAALQRMHSSESVFYASTQGNDPLEPIAKSVTLRKVQGKNPKYYLSWSDVSHQRKFEVKSITVLNDGVEFEDKQGRVIQLTLLTLERYNSHIKERVHGPSFTSDREVTDYFRNQAW